jgi:hypothetical protein
MIESLKNIEKNNKNKNNNNNNNKNNRGRMVLRNQDEGSKRRNEGLALVSSLLLLVLLSWSVQGCLGLRSGDLIRTEKQSWFDGVTSGWTELVAHDCPRFLQDRSLRLPALTSQEDRALTYKL